MPVPYTFGTATAAIPLSQLDSNFATAITLGNTAVYLGNTTTTLGNLTLTNVTISSGNVTVTGANVSGTANITTLVTTNDATISGLTVGRGGAGGAANTAYGASAIPIAPNSGVTAIGSNAGKLFNTASDTGQSTFVGYFAGAQVSTGTDSTFVGGSAGTSTTTGAKNTAVGSQALQLNTTASFNTAVGYQAGYTNVTGIANTFTGYQAGYTSNASSVNGYNTATGYQAGKGLTTGNNNSFFGFGSGLFITSGGKNVIVGSYDGNTGGLDIRTASNYIVLSDGDGNPRMWYDTGTTWFSPSTYSGTTATAANMNIASNGAIQRSTSALKYKQDIRDVEDFDISALRPVRYKSKCENDDQTKDHLGLIADEAAEAGFEELVARGANGEVEGFQYERLTVVLLKAMQTLKAEVDSLKAQINGASA